MQQGDAAPKAEPRPVVVDAAGVTYEDPFSWLEEDSPETLAWQAAQNAVAERALRDVEGFDELRRSLEAARGLDLRERPPRLAATAGSASPTARAASGSSAPPALRGPGARS